LLSKLINQHLVIRHYQKRIFQATCPAYRLTNHGNNCKAE
jgi:hypothetical protein